MEIVWQREEGYEIGNRKPSDSFAVFKTDGRKLESPRKCRLVTSSKSATHIWEVLSEAWFVNLLNRKASQ